MPRNLAKNQVKPNASKNPGNKWKSLENRFAWLSDVQDCVRRKANLGFEYLSTKKSGPRRCTYFTCFSRYTPCKYAYDWFTFCFDESDKIYDIISYNIILIVSCSCWGRTNFPSRHHWEFRQVEQRKRIKTQPQFRRKLYQMEQPHQSPKDRIKFESFIALTDACA